MPEMTDAELRALARRLSQTDPMPGTDWRESLTGRVYRVVNKPIDPDTLAALVVYYEAGNPIYCSTVERFLGPVAMPDGSTRPRFVPHEP